MRVVNNADGKRIMPKTFKDLYPGICAFENLYRAFRKARRGGKRKKERVAAFELDLEANLWRLHEELSTQSYGPGPYHNFYILERKLRLISAAPFRDRVVHHALCNRRDVLRRADVELEKLRLHLRLSMCSISSRDASFYTGIDSPEKRPSLPPRHKVTKDF